MDALVARFLQPVPLALAALGVALVMLAIATVAVGLGLETNSIGSADVSPFRWA